jgi:cellulose synthase operon protein C
VAMSGDVSGARQALDDALEIAPRFVYALQQKALLDESAGRRDEAIDTYRRLLDVDANNVVALNNLAFALAVHQKMPMEALGLAKRAVALAPSNPTILDTLAWIQHLLGDNAAAAKVMEQVIKTNIPDPDVRLHAAVVFAAAGAPAVAKQQLSIALKLNPALADNAEVKQLQAQLAK